MGCTASGPKPEVDTTNSTQESKKKRKPKVQPPFEQVVADPSRKLVTYYTMGKRIGRGHYGLVFAGQDRRSGRPVAVKRIERSMCTAQRLKEEIEILRRAGRHKFVVELIDAFETDTHVELVMELMQGGELYGRISKRGPYSEVKAALITRRIASAVHFLHKHNIVHRDLKPENLLLLSKTHEEAIKLADFGLAKLLVNQTHMTTVCGTWAYSAPEVRIKRQPYTKAVDIWSMGVILYTILGGYHPFDPYGVCSESELENNVKHLEYDFDDEAWVKVSSEVKHLIRSMLQLNPKKRPTAKRILLHPWIRKYAPKDIPVPGWHTRPELDSCKAKVAESDDSSEEEEEEEAAAAAVVLSPPPKPEKSHKKHKKHKKHKSNKAEMTSKADKARTAEKVSAPRAGRPPALRSPRSEKASGAPRATTDSQQPTSVSLDSVKEEWEPPTVASPRAPARGRAPHRARAAAAHAVAQLSGRPSLRPSVRDTDRYEPMLSQSPTRQPMPQYRRRSPAPMPGGRPQPGTTPSASPVPERRRHVSLGAAPSTPTSPFGLRLGVRQRPRGSGAPPPVDTTDADFKDKVARHMAKTTSPRASGRRDVDANPTTPLSRTTARVRLRTTGGKPAPYGLEDDTDLDMAAAEFDGRKTGPRAFQLSGTRGRPRHTNL